MSNIVKKDGFDFAFDIDGCSLCDGNCCIGESGYIWMTPTEINNMANYLNMDVEELKNKYLTKIKYKYSIKEKKVSEDNFACIFFDLQKKCCGVYDVRPKQCRTFPFWDYFKNNTEEVENECPAIRLL
jgi:Fe-S-cluster containining protein